MIYIQKAREPHSLTQYKKQENANYGNLPSNVKDDIRLSLLKEQGFLCAYCSRRIKSNQMKI